MIGVSSIKSTFIQFVDWNGVAWWARMINACMFRRCGLVFKHKNVQERAAWGVSSFLYIVFCCSAATFHQPGGASLAMGFVLTVLTIRFPQKIIPYFYNLLYTFPIQTRISLVTLVKPLQHNKKRMDFLMTFWIFRVVSPSRPRPTMAFGISSPTALPRAGPCWWLARPLGWPSWAWKGRCPLDGAWTYHGIAWIAKGDLGANRTCI